MLSIWPIVAAILYHRLSPERALIWTVLGGYLLLPPVVALDLPLVPDLDKHSIPSLAAALLVILHLRGRIPVLPQGSVGKLLMGLFILSPFATVLTNGDPIHFTEGWLPGMRIYDSISAVANQMIALLPFFLARRYLASAEAMRAMLVALMVAGLIYSVPMLIEVRLSPQLNLWIYGFFQHDFSQTMRFGGFRPFVFLEHGLWVAFFALMAAMAALTLWRTTARDLRGQYTLAMLYLAVILVLCKSVGPITYALVLAPLVLMASPRTQLLLAGAAAVIVLVYPMLRGAQLVPLDAIVEFAKGFNYERAMSLQFRIDNEELLLAHANERPLFGWGGYSRNLVHDPRTGGPFTISDGAWIIVMGIYGWLGYIAEFGLLTLPLLALARAALARGKMELSPHAAAIALLLVANLIDLLPNATLIPFTWLMAGALLGHAEALVRAPVQAVAWRRRTVL